MTALARAISQVTGSPVDLASLRTIVVFCGAGLLLSLLCMLTYGLDLSPGFF